MVAALFQPCDVGGAVKAHGARLWQDRHGQAARTWGRVLGEKGVRSGHGGRGRDFRSCSNEVVLMCVAVLYGSKVGGRRTEGGVGSEIAGSRANLQPRAGVHSSSPSHTICCLV